MLIIGIAGGTGSGKTTVVRKIIESLPKDEVAVIPQDCYYKDNAHIPLEERLKMNYDEPASIEWSLLANHVRELKEGKAIEMPTYDFITCSRLRETIHVEPRDVVVVALRAGVVAARDVTAGVSAFARDVFCITAVRAVVARPVAVSVFETVVAIRCCVAPRVVAVPSRTAA